MLLLLLKAYSVLISLPRPPFPFRLEESSDHIMYLDGIARGNNHHFHIACDVPIDFTWNEFNSLLLHVQRISQASEFCGFSIIFRNLGIIGVAVALVFIPHE